MPRSVLTRRHCLTRTVAALAAPSLLGACSVGPSMTGGSARRREKAAMLLPLSGRSEGVGARLNQATEMGGGLPVYDTGSSPETAAAAAAQAVQDGATVLAGPLFSAATRAVLRAVPRDVPVLSLSNDATLADEGAFVMGITPLQSTQTVLGFTADKGIQSVVMVAPDGPLGARFAEATRRVTAGLDLRVGTSLIGSLGSDLASDLRAALDGRLPDAVYLPSAGPSFPTLASAADRTGSQLVGSTQWNGSPNLALPALEGAFFSSPDPATLAPFALTFQDRFGTAPGLLAALAHDASTLAAKLAGTGDARRALLASGGHEGALGRYRFAANGRAARQLAVLQLQGGSGFLVS